MTAYKQKRDRAMPGSAKAMKGERSERDAMASNLMLLSGRTTLTMMRKVRKRKQRDDRKGENTQNGSG